MKRAAIGITCFILIAWLAAPLFAQEKRVLTLQDSIALALERNPNHLATEKRVEAARAGVRQATAAFFPSLNAQGTKNLDEKVMQLDFPTETGETQRVEVDFTRDYQATVTLAIPIFTGGQLVGGFKSANYNLKAMEEGVRQSRQATVFSTKQVFYGILVAREFVKVAEEAVAISEKLHEDIKIKYEVGLASQFDLLRSEVQLANLNPQLIKARNNLRIMELNLMTILALDQEEKIEVTGELNYEPMEPDLDVCMAEALRSRPELRQMDFQKKMAGENLRIARATGLPKVMITGQYNYWGDKFNFKKDTWSNYYTVNLVVDLPIFNGFAAHARVAEAKASIKEVELTRRGLIDLLKFEVRQAILKLNEARETLLGQEKNVEQAQESLRIAQLNFDEGMIALIDFQQAQTALTEAKTNYYQALYDYVLATADLDRAMGVG
jgi:outer membrane protein TolC